MKGFIGFGSKKIIIKVSVLIYDKMNNQHHYINIILYISDLNEIIKLPFSDQR